MIKKSSHTAELLPTAELLSSSKKSNKALKTIVSAVGELEANPSVLNIIEECCRKAGVTTELVYGVLREGLGATLDSEVVNNEGTVTNGLKPDYSTRHKYMLTALELLKHLKDKNVVAVTGIFNDPDISADAERILSLRRGINGKG